MSGIPERPDWDDRDEETFGLVMPFVAVVSKGGPYDDPSFVAGYQAGEINGKLESRRIAAATFLIYTTLIEQVDLIAMRHGYTSEVLHRDETWCQIGVTRNDEVIDG